MKSTRKHELQTNELADAIGRLIERAKPHAGTLAMVGVAVIVAVVVLVIVPIMRGSAADLAVAAFNTACGAGDVQSLRNFVEDYPDAAQAPTARLLLADRTLAEAVRGTASTGSIDPKAADRLLAEAKDLYGQVAESSEILAPLAKVGLALVTVQEGDLKKGREALQEVVSKWPQSIASEKARAHIEALAGYKPLVFSNEPLEEPKKPEPDEAERAESKEGEAEQGPSPEAESKTPEAEPAPAPKAAGGQEQKEPEPAGC